MQNIFGSNTRRVCLSIRLQYVWHWCITQDLILWRWLRNLCIKRRKFIAYQHTHTNGSQSTNYELIAPLNYFFIFIKITLNRGFFFTDNFESVILPFLNDAITAKFNLINWINYFGNYPRYSQIQDAALEINK